MINRIYWKAIDEIQAEREAGRPVDEVLHLLTVSYEKVARSEVRAGYNMAIGLAAAPITSRPLRPGRPFGAGAGSFDYYEVLGLHPGAPQEVVGEASSVMNAHYRLIDIPADRREILLRLLERARETLGSVSGRRRYDETLEVHRNHQAGSLLATVATTLRRLRIPFGRVQQPQSHPASIVGRLRTYIGADASA